LGLTHVARFLAQRLQIERKVNRKLSAAAIETLAIRSPITSRLTRAEIGRDPRVIISRARSTCAGNRLDQAARPRETPGRPVTWATPSSFLSISASKGRKRARPSRSCAPPGLL